MKKIVKAIGAFLAMMMIITPVLGCDACGTNWVTVLQYP